MKISKAPGLMKYPYTIEATEEEFRAIMNAIGKSYSEEEKEEDY